MLQAALDFEVEAYVENLQLEKDERGQRPVVRNGWTGRGNDPRDP